MEALVNRKKGFVAIFTVAKATWLETGDQVGYIVYSTNLQKPNMYQKVSHDQAWVANRASAIAAAQCNPVAGMVSQLSILQNLQRIVLC